MKLTKIRDNEQVPTLAVDSNANVDVEGRNAFSLDGHLTFKVPYRDEYERDVRIFVDVDPGQKQTRTDPAYDRSFEITEIRYKDNDEQYEGNIMQAGSFEIDLWDAIDSHGQRERDERHASRQADRENDRYYR